MSEWLNVVFILTQGEAHEGGSVQGVFVSEKDALAASQALIERDNTEHKASFKDALARAKQCATDCGVPFSFTEFKSEWKEGLWDAQYSVASAPRSVVMSNWEGKPSSQLFKVWERSGEWIKIEAHRLEISD